MKAEILNEEAYVTTFSLNTEFKYNGKQYYASCIYYNGDGIEDIDVWNEKEDPIADYLVDDLYKIAQEIFHNMNIEKHLTY